MILVLAIFLIVGSALLPFAGRMTGLTGLQRMSAAVAGLYRRVVGMAFAVAAASGLLIALVQIANLLLRNIFAVNIIKMQESLLYFFGAMFLLGAGGILLRDGHVRVDVFHSGWSEPRKRIIDILGTVVFLFPVCILILIASGPYVAQSWETLERSAEPSGIHAVFLMKSMIPTFAVLVAMAGVCRLHDLLLGDDHAR